MALIDISVGDLVFSKTEQADTQSDVDDQSADSDAESTDSIESTEPVATDADGQGDESSITSPTRRSRLRGVVTRGRLRTAGKTAGGIATFAVALLGLFAIAVVTALAIALKVRKKL